MAGSRLTKGANQPRMYPTSVHGMPRFTNVAGADIGTRAASILERCTAKGAEDIEPVEHNHTLIKNTGVSPFLVEACADLPAVRG